MLVYPDIPYFLILGEVSGKITSHSAGQYLYFVGLYAKTEMRKTGARVPTRSVNVTLELLPSNHCAAPPCTADCLDKAKQMPLSMLLPV